MSKCILASGLKPAAKEKLTLLGYEITEFHYNESVSREVMHHADLSFLDCGDGVIFIAKEMNDYRSFLENYGYTVRVLENKLGSKYPDDVPLNCVVLDEYLICNVDTVSEAVLQYFRDKKIINVRQGYTKCSVIPVNGSAVITDDETIAKQCMRYSIDVLKVSKGCVVLDGFDYGFIGGTAGRISDTEIVFNGDIMTHPDSNKIVSFLNKYGITAVSLAKGKLYDIGSMIVIDRRI